MTQPVDIPRLEQRITNGLNVLYDMEVTGEDQRKQTDYDQWLQRFWGLIEEYRRAVGEDERNWE